MDVGKLLEKISHEIVIQQDEKLLLLLAQKANL